METLNFCKAKKLIVSLFVIGLSITSVAQNYFKEFEETAIVPDQSNFMDIPKESTIYGNIRKVESLMLSVRLGVYALGNTYNLGEGGSYFFETTIRFKLRALDKNNAEVDGIFKDGFIELVINNDQPEHMYNRQLDLKKVVSTNDPLHEGWEIDKIEIYDVEYMPNPGNLVNTYFITGHINTEYAYGVHINKDQTIVSQPICQEPVINGRTAQFRWEHTYAFNTYQLQVLKLYNNSEDNLTQNNIDAKRITAELDWSDAMTFQIHIEEPLDDNGNVKELKNIDYTLGEGTGYYAWRVRPVGSFYKGAIANSDNWGPWSDADEGEITLDNSETNPAYFYHNDRDAGKNWIYSRVMDEEGKTKETVTYATSLNQVRQTQTYISSEDITLTTHTVLDYAGRPSLTSLPAPVESKIDQYAANFLRSGGNLYSAENYAGDDKSGEADLVDEDGRMDYYNNNPDVRISDSEGYPIVTQSYYDDPLGRVKEEGGPGGTHRIKQDGTGRTRKYYFEVPDEEELVKLFGNEAPNKESVTKTVSVDENNISTVTYIDLSGKTLATCLMISEQDDGLLMPLDNQNFYSRSKTENLVENETTEWGFMSRKKIILMQETTVNISYQVKQQQLDASCILLDLNCNFLLDVLIHDIENNTIIEAATDISVKNDPTSQEQTINGEEYLVLENLSEIVLLPGTYVIEKRLKPGKTQIDHNKALEDIENQIDPITGVLTNWYDSIMCEEMLPDFHQSIYNMRDAINAGTLDEFENTGLQDVFPAEFGMGFSEIYNRELYGTDPVEYAKDRFFMQLFYLGDDNILHPIADNQYNEEPYMAVLGTACCTIEIMVKWIKQFNYEVVPELKAGPDGILQVHSVLEDVEPEFIPDFEGYAMAYFEHCETLNNKQFYNYMDGWYQEGHIPEGTFNLMVYHMVNDEMPCDNPIIEREKIEFGEETFSDSQEPYYDDCGNLINPGDGNGRYTVVGLFNCWQGILELLKNKAGCKLLVDFGSDETVNVSNELDGEAPGEHDPHFDNNIGKVPWVLRWLVKRKVSRKMRDIQMDAGGDEDIRENLIPQNFHMIKDFFECSGYSFVKILTPYDATPLPEDMLTIFPYATELDPGQAALNGNSRYKLTEGITSAEFFAICRRTGAGGGQAGDYPYVPLTDWNPQEKNSDGTYRDESLFPRIKNPIYAFKYFTYPEEGLQKTRDFELANCYSDPNDCYIVEDSYLKEENGKPMKVPCCLSSYDPAATSVDLYWEDFCYADANYPYLEDHMVLAQGNDLRFQEVNGKDTRLIVNEFTNKGRVRCPYTKEYWSCGQRNTFYKDLKEKKNLSQEDWLAPPARTAEDYTTPTLLWLNTEMPEEYPLIVIDREKVAIIAAGASPLTQYVNYKKWDTESGEDVDINANVTITEIEVVGIINSCKDKAKALQKDFYDKIVSMLLDRCYEIGECKGEGPEYDHIVPEEDVWQMIKALVDQAVEQCEDYNTFSCEEVSSRDIHSPVTVLHYNSSYVKSAYGMGGSPNNEIACDGSINNETYADIHCTTGIDCDGDGAIDIYDCSAKEIYANHGLQVDEDDFSWYQYTKIQQVMGWDFELDLPSVCVGEEGTRILDIDDCTGGTEGSTFVKKREYELRESEIHDENNIRSGNPVESPVKKIVVEIQ